MFWVGRSVASPAIPCALLPARAVYDLPHMHPESRPSQKSASAPAISPRQRFIAKLAASLEDGTFVKLTLSKPRPEADTLKNVYGRTVELKSGPALSLVHRHATRDLTQNHPFKEGVREIEALLSAKFECANLFTTGGDWQLRCRPDGEGKLQASRPAFQAAPDPSHDRAKKSAFGANPPAFLQALGVTGPDGTSRPGMSDKLRQIERFVELFWHLLDDSPLKEKQSIRVLDAGSGKGYLTFAIHHALTARGIAAEVIGVEIREDMATLTNRIARECQCEGLSFIQGTIGSMPQEPLDILVALHACDTATDDALFHGISSGVQLLVVAPCCHQEVRPQIESPAVLRSMLKHGILLEREAEILTDSMRALLLEIHGFRANVFEFVSLEHTGRNVMIAAHRRSQDRDVALLQAEFDELARFFGVREQRLAKLLAGR